MRVLNEREILVEVVERPRHGFVPLDDLRLIERAGWFQIITPSFRQGGFDEVAHSVLEEDEANAVIERTIAEYRSLGIKFRWSVGPGSRPMDLGDRLARAGLVPSIVRGMARSTEPTIEESASISIESVDLANVDMFTRVMAEGWNMAPEPLERAHAVIVASEQSHHLFLARVDGKPCGAAGYVAFPRSAYLAGGVVLPTFRRRGVYQALVARRLADARARGLSLATSHARDLTSAPLLERFGFTTVCSFTSYTGAP